MRPHILQKYQNIKSWMRADETHVFCNTFSLVMICRMKDIGDLMDHIGEELTSINGLVDDIADIQH